MEGKESTVSLGKSVIVPSVQELAKGCLQQLPQRYVWSDQDSPILRDDNEEQEGVPIIDMEALYSGDEVELHKLHSACQQRGFFQIINHGVSSSLLEEFKLKTQEFFNLPMEEKKKYWQTPINLEGFGQAFVISEEQKLDWADMFYMTTFPKYLRKSYLFPMLPLPYRQTMENYVIEMQKLARKILKCMENALNIDTELESSIFGEGYQSIRMNYYPPCPEPQKAIGLTPHTDSIALITILFQMNEMQGLQVYKDNKWVAINFLPDAFVVNIGDMLEVMTNGIYKSLLHRAIVNATKERTSVATFHSPTLDHEVGPNPNFVTSSNPPKFRRMVMADYWKKFLSRPLDGKGCFDDVWGIAKDEGNSSL